MLVCSDRYSFSAGSFLTSSGKTLPRFFFHVPVHVAAFFGGLFPSWESPQLDSISSSGSVIIAKNAFTSTLVTLFFFLSSSSRGLTDTWDGVRLVIIGISARVAETLRSLDGYFLIICGRWLGKAGSVNRRIIFGRLYQRRLHRESFRGVCSP